MVKIPEYERSNVGSEAALLNAPFQAVGNEEAVVNKRMAPDLLRSEQNLKNVNAIVNNMKSISNGMLKYADSIDEGNKNKALNTYRAELMSLDNKLKKDYQGLNAEQIGVEYKKAKDSILNKMDVPFRKRKEFQIQADSISTGFEGNLADYAQKEIEKEKNNQFKALLDNNVLDVQNAPHMAANDLKTKIDFGSSLILEKGTTDGVSPEVIKQAQGDHITQIHQVRVNAFLGLRKPNEARTALEMARGIADPKVFNALESKVIDLEYDFKAHNIAKPAFDNVVNNKMSTAEAYMDVYKKSSYDPYVQKKALDGFTYMNSSYQKEVVGTKDRIQEYSDKFYMLSEAVMGLKSMDDAVVFLEKNTENTFGIHAEAIKKNLLQIYLNKQNGSDKNIVDDQQVVANIRNEQIVKDGESLTLFKEGYKLSSGTRQRLIDEGLKMRELAGKSGSGTGSGGGSVNQSTAAYYNALQSIYKSNGLLDKDGKVTSKYGENAPIIDATLNSLIETFTKENPSLKPTPEMYVKLYNDQQFADKNLDKALESNKMSLNTFSLYNFGVPIDEIENPNALLYDVKSNFTSWAAKTPAIDRMSDPEKYESLTKYLRENSYAFLATASRHTGKYDKVFMLNDNFIKTTPKTVMYGHEPMQYEQLSNINLNPFEDKETINTISNLYPDIVSDLGATKVKEIVDLNRQQIVSALGKYTPSEEISNRIIDDFNEINFSSTIDELFPNGKVISNVDIDSSGVFYTDDARRNDSINSAISNSPIDGSITSKYQPEGRIHPVDGVVKAHNGIDIACVVKSPLKSTHSGVVTEVGYQADGAGKYVDITDEDNGIKSRFFHLDTINVEVGDFVSANDIEHPFALSGNTGKVTGDGHLHWEVLVKNDKGNWVHIDPLGTQNPVQPIETMAETEPVATEEKKDRIQDVNYSKSGDIRLDSLSQNIQTFDNIRTSKLLLANPMEKDVYRNFRDVSKTSTYTNQVNQLVNNFKKDGISGVKYRASRGQMVYATTSGYITSLLKDEIGSEYVLADENNNINIKYSNLKVFDQFLKDGQYVSAGDAIGYIKDNIDDNGYNLIYSVR